MHQLVILWRKKQNDLFIMQNPHLSLLILLHCFRFMATSRPSSSPTAGTRLSTIHGTAAIFTGLHLPTGPAPHSRPGLPVGLSTGGSGSPCRTATPGCGSSTDTPRGIRSVCTSECHTTDTSCSSSSQTVWRIPCQ